MASFVIVVDASARRVKVKTLPGKFLSEVLQEACSEWRYDASRHGLRNNNKTLDLSRTIRLSGLSSGAKLELVKLSKSPSVISVALQLPESEKEGVPNGRLTDKFPSSISLWQILRRFESATAGGLGAQKNFTSRGAPSMNNGGSGAGRLYYEHPVLQIIGREYSSLADLQKSLSQLGFNDGSVLLKLSFRTSSVPLEQAQQEVETYFKSLEEGTDSLGAHSGAVGGQGSTPDISQQILTEEEQESKTPDTKSPVEPLESCEPVDADNDRFAGATANSTVGGRQEALTASYPSISSLPEATATHTASDIHENAEDANDLIDVSNGSTATGPAKAVSSPQLNHGSASNNFTLSTEANVTGPDRRPISVYAPPSSITPYAARQPHNEKDYEPTITQYQHYQAHLGKISQQRRLQSDSEIEAQQKAQVEKLANTKEVEIKVRFPNQVQVVATFNSLDTSVTLYEHVKGLMENESEPFTLQYTSAKGSQEVPKNSTARLISDLGMFGRVLVTVGWDAGASTTARSGNVVKARFREAAQEIEVQEVEDGTVEDKPNLGWGRLGEGQTVGNGKSSGAMKLLNKLRKK